MGQARWTTRGMIAAVAWCGLLFALARLPGMDWLVAIMLLTAGPICGVIVQRCCGGKGILGGVIGGIASYCGYGVVMYLIAYRHPLPGTGDLLGPEHSFLCLHYLVAWSAVALEFWPGR